MQVTFAVHLWSMPLPVQSHRHQCRGNRCSSNPLFEPPKKQPGTTSLLEHAAGDLLEAHSQLSRSWSRSYNLIDGTHLRASPFLGLPHTRTIAPALGGCGMSPQHEHRLPAFLVQLLEEEERLLFQAETPLLVAVYNVQRILPPIVLDVVPS